MPEEGIETQELKEKLEEAAEGGGESAGARWLLWLSLSTAIIAVLAAIASLESGDHANEAIILKTEATLTQSRADDAWGYYQAKSIKQEMLATLSELAPRPELAAAWKARAETEKREKIEKQAEAEKLGKEVAEGDTEARRHLDMHHQFARSVTVFQVAIALAAIAALTRRRFLWWVSLAIGAGGGLFFVLGFLTH
ncbi:MAG: DUF4337 family protein [Polyangiaceae bacterium]